MNDKSKRIARLRAEHPVCYFCATAPTETEDHVPSRECFKGRIGPEGYAFPACARCNGAAGSIEQVVALYLHLADFTDGEPPRKQIEKLKAGVENNNPELLPTRGDARTARRHFREKQISLAPGMTYADAPIAELPAGNRAAFEVFARRLVCALYYKEVGRPVPLDFYISTGWLPFSDPGAPNFTDRVRNWLPDVRMTNRRNTNIGHQFFYLWGARAEGDIFVFAAQFSKSFFFLGAAAAPTYQQDLRHGWKQHSEDISELDAKRG